MEDIKKVVYKLEIDDSAVAKVSDKVGRNLHKLDQGVQRIQKTSQVAVNNIVETLKESNNNELNAMAKLINHAVRKQATAARLVSRITELAQAGGLTNADMARMQHVVRTQIQDQQQGFKLNQYGFTNNQWAEKSARVYGGLAAQKSRELNIAFKQEQQAKANAQKELDIANRNANRFARQDAKREEKFKANEETKEAKRKAAEQRDLDIAARNANKFARQDAKREAKFFADQATKEQREQAELYGVKTRKWMSMSEDERKVYSDFFNTHGYTVADNQRFNRMARKDAASEERWKASEQRKIETQNRIAKSKRQAEIRSEERRRLGNLNRVSNITQHGMVGMSSFLGSFGGSLLGTSSIGSYFQPIAGFGATGAGLGSTIGAAAGTLFGGPIGGMAGGAMGMIGGGVAGMGIGTITSAASMAVDLLVGGVKTAINVVKTGGSYLLQQGMTYERDLTKMGVLTGSEAGGRLLYGQIESLAIKTPYTTSQLSKEGETLLGYGVDPSRVPKALSQLGDIAAGDPVRLNRLSYAYGQVMSQGRLMAQELRQFSEAGVGAADVAQTLGISVAQLKARMEAGVVGSDALKSTLDRLTSQGGRFYGMNEKVNKTFGGQLNSLQESFEMVSKRIGMGVIDRYDLAGKTKGIVGFLSDPANQKKATDVITTTIDKSIQFFDGLSKSALFPRMEQAFNAGSAFVERMLNSAGVNFNGTAQQNGEMVGRNAAWTFDLGSRIGGAVIGAFTTPYDTLFGEKTKNKPPTFGSNTIRQMIRQRASWEQFLPDEIDSIVAGTKVSLRNQSYNAVMNNPQYTALQKQKYHDWYVVSNRNREAEGSINYGPRPFDLAREKELKDWLASSTNFPVADMTPLRVPNFATIGSHIYNRVGNYLAGWMNPFTNTNPDSPNFVGNAFLGGGLGIAGAMTGRIKTPIELEAMQRDIDARKVKGLDVLDEYYKTARLVKHGMVHRNWSSADAGMLLNDPIQNIIQMGKSLESSSLVSSASYGSDAANSIIQMAMSDKDDQDKMLQYIADIEEHTKQQKEFTERMMKILEQGKVIQVGDIK